jgi:hypothetical protein
VWMVGPLLRDRRFCIGGLRVGNGWGVGGVGSSFRIFSSAFTLLAIGCAIFSVISPGLPRGLALLSMVIIGLITIFPMLLFLLGSRLYHPILFCY